MKRRKGMPGGYPTLPDGYDYAKPAADKAQISMDQFKKMRTLGLFNSYSLKKEDGTIYTRNGKPLLCYSLQEILDKKEAFTKYYVSTSPEAAPSIPMIRLRDRRVKVAVNNPTTPKEQESESSPTITHNNESEDSTLQRMRVSLMKISLDISVIKELLFKWDK